MKLVDQLISKVEATTGVRIPEPMRHPINITWVLAQDLIRCDLMKQASAMAYVTLLSLIPSLVAIFCVISLFSPLMGSGTDMVEQMRDFILNNLAPESADSLVGYFDKTLDNLNLASLGWKSFAGVLVSLILLLRQIEEALNRIWFIRKGRNVFTRFMYFWTFLTLGILVLGLAVGLSGGFNLDTWLSPDAAASQAGLPGWLVGIVGGFIFFFFLFKIVPNCFVHARHAAVGAIVSSVLLHQSARIYGIYIKSAVNYQTLYGALAMLPLFLMWLYICWIIILLGALISWRMQEGFPQASREDTLDAVSSPLDQLRNMQVKAAMPLIALIWIYKNFQKGGGRGVSCQDIAHSLHMPLDWISDALDALTSMGYIIASRSFTNHATTSAATDPYFPTFPADTLTVARLHTDLARPAEEWFSHLKQDLPFDLARSLAVFDSAEIRNNPKATFAEALARTS